jgi:hypothetical protein
MKRIGLALSVAFVLSFRLFAASLSDVEMENAIACGKNDTCKLAYYWFTGIFWGGTISTTEVQIAALTRNAKRSFQKFTVNDVGPDLRERRVLIHVAGATPAITRIVILPKSKDGKVLDDQPIEPIASIPAERTFGGKPADHTLTAYFDPKGIPVGDFAIGIIFDGSTRKIQHVKRGDLKKAGVEF